MGVEKKKKRERKRKRKKERQGQDWLLVGNIQHSFLVKNCMFLY